jgi:DNA-binding CsgD family transcriptional regulator
MSVATSPRALDAELRAMVELATTCRSRHEFRSAAVDRLARLVGFDRAFVGELVPTTNDPPYLWNVLSASWEAFRASGPAMLAELAPLAQRARQSGGVASDHAVFDARARDRLDFYVHCVRPNHSKATLAVHLALGGKETCVMHLGRAGQYDGAFDDRAVSAVRHLVPALALGDAIHRAATPERARDLAARDPGRYRLTPREREIVELVTLGLGNREIALACGTSINTVRNQLAAVFAKVGVGTRSELVRLALTEGIVTPRDRRL